MLLRMVLRMRFTLMVLRMRFTLQARFTLHTLDPGHGLKAMAPAQPHYPMTSVQDPHHRLVWKVHRDAGSEAKATKNRDHRDTDGAHTQYEAVAQVHSDAVQAPVHANCAQQHIATCTCYTHRADSKTQEETGHPKDETKAQDKSAQLKKAREQLVHAVKELVEHLELQRPR